LNRGHDNVSVLSGGLSEWSKAGYPVTQTKTRPAGDKRPGRIPPKKAREGLQRFLVLDVRPALEFSAGHLPGAANIPLEGLKTSLANIPKDKELLIYDRQAKRSRQAAQELMNAGYAVSELTGGLSAWINMKYEVEVK